MAAIRTSTVLSDQDELRVLQIREALTRDSQIVDALIERVFGRDGVLPRSEPTTADATRFVVLGPRIEEALLWVRIDENDSFFTDVTRVQQVLKISATGKLPDFLRNRTFLTQLRVVLDELAIRLNTLVANDRRIDERLSDQNRRDEKQSGTPIPIRVGARGSNTPERESLAAVDDQREAILKNLNSKERELTLQTIGNLETFLRDRDIFGQLTVERYPDLETFLAENFPQASANRKVQSALVGNRDLLALFKERREEALRDVERYRREQKQMQGASSAVATLAKANLPPSVISALQNSDLSVSDVSQIEEAVTRVQEERQRTGLSDSKTLQTALNRYLPASQRRLLPEIFGALKNDLRFSPLSDSKSLLVGMTEEQQRITDETIASLQTILRDPKLRATISLDRYQDIETFVTDRFPAAADPVIKDALLADANVQTLFKESRATIRQSNPKKATRDILASAALPSEVISALQNTDLSVSDVAQIEEVITRVQKVRPTTGFTDETVLRQAVSRYLPESQRRFLPQLLIGLQATIQTPPTLSIQPVNREPLAAVLSGKNITADSQKEILQAIERSRATDTSLSPAEVRKRLELYLPTEGRGLTAELAETILSTRAPTTALPTYSSLDTMLRDYSEKSAIRILELRIDSLGLAGAIVTTKQGRAVATQVLEAAIDQLSRTSPVFAKSMENPAFAASVRERLQDEMRAARSELAGRSGRLYAVADRAQSPAVALAQVTVLVESLGGRSAAILTLTAKKSELEVLVERLQKSGGGSSPPPLSSQSPSDTSREPGTATSDTGATAIAKDLARAEGILRENVTQAKLSGSAAMSLEEYQRLAIDSTLKGEQLKKAQAIVEAQYYGVYGDVGFEADLSPDLASGALVAQERLAEVLGVDPSTTPIAESLFIPYDLPSTDNSGGGVYEFLGSDLGEEPASLTQSRGAPGRLVGLTRRFSVARKNSQRAKNLMNAVKNAKFFANPAGMAGLGVGSIGAATLVGGLTQGLAGAAGAATFGITGALGGAATGFFVGGPVGAGIGFFVGGTAGSFGSLLVPIGEGSAAQWVGQNVWGIQSPINLQGAASSVQASAAQLGNAAAQTLPGAATNAATTAQSLAQSAAATTSNATTAAINGTRTLLAALPSAGGTAPMGGVIVGVVGTTTAVSVLTMATILSSFLTPGQLEQQCSEHICVEKTPNPDYADNPVPVTYTIGIVPKEAGKEIVITKITDTMTVAFDSATKNPAPATPTLDAAAQASVQTLLGALSENGKTTTYTVNFDSQYDDTRITNQLLIEYTVNGVTDTYQAEAAVTFGDAPAAGCWPVSGTITQLPYSGNSTHINKDSYDIAAAAGTPVISPYSGNALVFPEGSAGETWLGAGNFIVIQSDLGYDFLFQHLSEFSITSGPVSAGDVIGKVGSTGNSTGPHLHYEVRRGKWNVLPDCALGGGSCLGEPSLLATLVPPDVSGQRVTRTEQTVSAETCGAGSGGETLVREGCFVFSNQGDKPWAEAEITRVRTVLKNEILSDAPINQLVCTNGSTPQDVVLTRKSGTCQDDGGSWAGYTSRSSIQFCDNLFTGDFLTTTFGRSTVLHEPAHLIQLRHNSDFSSAFTPVKGIFETTGSFYTDTYPYRLDTADPNYMFKVGVENFGEAFGLCRGLVNNSTSGYRGKYVGNGAAGLAKYAAECTAMYGVIQRMSR